MLIGIVGKPNVGKSTFSKGEALFFRQSRIKFGLAKKNSETFFSGCGKKRSTALPQKKAARQSPIAKILRGQNAYRNCW